jgi:hypothetical protein
MRRPFWRKSSRSGPQGGDCVEVAKLSGTIGLRDSKNPSGGHVAVEIGQFAALVQRIKRDDLSL